MTEGANAVTKKEELMKRILKECNYIHEMCKEKVGPKSHDDGDDKVKEGWKKEIEEFLKNIDDEKIDRLSLLGEKPQWDEIKKKPFQLFNDPIHGSIEFNALEQAIINTPEFFRLKDIKQLGGAVHVYPGATHTRFEHSLGVCYLAGKFVKRLRTRLQEIRKYKPSEPGPKEISYEEELCVRVAALCHDLGHGPFSHLFERIAKKMLEGEKLLEHDKISNLVFRKILKDNSKVLVMFVLYGLKFAHVEMIEGMIVPDEKKKDKMFLYEIVANKNSGMDVDKWDYFARDCQYLGISYDFDWQRCMKLSTIVKVGDQYHIGFRDKQAANILGMYRSRCILHQKACQHSTVNGIEMMIKDILLAVNDTVEVIQIDGKKITVKDALKELVVKETSERVDLRGYLAISDSILDRIMFAPVTIKMKGGKKEDNQEEKLKKARDLISKLMKRELYSSIADKSFPVEVNEGVLEWLDTKTVKDKVEKIKKEFPGSTKDSSVEIDSAYYKFPSESFVNPLKGIYFYEKETKDTIGFQEEKGVKDVSKVNIPRVYADYKLRIYTKNGDKSKREEYEVWLRNKKEEFEKFIKKLNGVKTGDEEEEKGRSPLAKRRKTTEY